MSLQISELYKIGEPHGWYLKLGSSDDIGAIYTPDVIIKPSEGILEVRQFTPLLRVGCHFFPDQEMIWFQTIRANYIDSLFDAPPTHNLGEVLDVRNEELCFGTEVFQRVRTDFKGAETLIKILSSTIEDKYQN